MHIITPDETLVGYTRYREAAPKDESAVDALAKLSPFTRDFANPPMSLKAMRKLAFVERQVWVGEQWNGKKWVIMGFIWCRPMKPKHMQFSTVYYMGIHPEARRKKMAKLLLRLALDRAKGGRIELVCEDGNEGAFEFYFNGCKGKPISTGTVGKDRRPYTRFAFVQGQKGL